MIKTEAAMRDRLRDWQVLSAEHTGGAVEALLPDACTRLEQIAALTDNASMRTRDLVEECGTLLRALEPTGPEQAGLVEGICDRLAELAATHGYQETTGRTLLRVAALVRAAHVRMGAVSCEAGR